MSLASDYAAARDAAELLIPPAFAIDRQGQIMPIASVTPNGRLKIDAPFPLILDGVEARALRRWITDTF